ncbi:7656_t:CDS:2, partial [Acaulospora colombiana]
MEAPRYTATRLCLHCEKRFPIAGGSFTKHESNCVRNQEEEREAAVFTLELNRNERPRRASKERHQESQVPSRKFHSMSGMLEETGEDATLGLETGDGLEDGELLPTQDPYVQVTPHPRGGQRPYVLGLVHPPDEPILGSQLLIPPYAPFPSEADFYFISSRVQRTHPTGISTSTSKICGMESGVTLVTSLSRIQPPQHPYGLPAGSAQQTPTASRSENRLPLLATPEEMAKSIASLQQKLSETEKRCQAAEEELQFLKNGRGNKSTEQDTTVLRPDSLLSAINIPVDYASGSG